MNGKEHFKEIAEKRSSRCGFWHGVPHDDSKPKLYSYFGVKNDFELGLKLGSLCRYVRPEEDCHLWQRTDYPMFDPMNLAANKSAELQSSGTGYAAIMRGEGVFANCEDVEEIHNYHWPAVDDCDFTETIREIDRTVEAGQAVLCSTWGSIFSNTWNFFGMENCMIKMFTHPDLVKAVTGHLTDFYLGANEILFSEAGKKIDSIFIGIDLGSQLDLLISPETFEEFLLPFIKKLLEQARRWGLHTTMHSCGSIYRVIPQLIAAGVEILHPIQALAKNMDALGLAEKYNGKIVFMGGIDTQRILPFGTPEEVKAEVGRVKKLLGPNYIVCASHETLLPNVSPENLAAMAEAALEEQEK
jgi:uroporphyrinogen decarboxylase